MSVARIERSEIRGLPAPGFAEFTLGLAEGKTRGLNPGYAVTPLSAHSEQAAPLTPTLSP
jgi:hypothetical protein